MSITSLSDWSAVELKAQTHELQQVDTMKVPPATIEQQLVWATTRCAELQAKVHRMQSNASVALMWLQAGDKARLQQAINQVILDL